MVGFFVPASGLFERLQQRLFYLFLFADVHHCQQKSVGFAFSFAVNAKQLMKNDQPRAR
jgi:hypothetical protein